MAEITISEGLGWKKILDERYAELVALRNQNSHNERRYIGANADKEIEHTPVYDIRLLDALIANIAREKRLLDAALKRTNATVNVVGYTQDDAVLGVVK